MQNRSFAKLRKIVKRNSDRDLFEKIFLASAIGISANPALGNLLPGAIAEISHKTAREIFFKLKNYHYEN